MNDSSPRTLVMKFGGTSVGTPDAMAQTAEIIHRQRTLTPRLVVVTSALSGVTDILLSSAIAAAEGDTTTYNQSVQTLRARHEAIIKALIPDRARQEEVKAEITLLILDFANLCQAISVLGEATPRALDAVASLGERMAVRLLAAVVDSGGTPAQYLEANRLIITDDHFQSAHPDFAATQIAARASLNPILDQGTVPIVTGFIGATSQGITTTLGRGGSDYTAAILGAVLPADEVWIWTDVDGVMTADPRIVPEARTIEELTYREVSELAYAGAKVLHPKTIRPVIEAGIGLRVLNTFNPEHPGTRLVAEKATPNGNVVKSVTAIRGLKLITVEGRGMLGVPGVAARTFAAIASTGTSVSLISQASSEQAICFAVPASSAEKVIAAIENEFYREIAGKDIDRVWATSEVVIVTVVGEGMRSTPGIAGKVFSALGEKQINVIAIAQGSSEVSISFVLKAEDIRAAVQTLHERVITQPSEGGLP
ncbi:aspartate kinase [Anaerolinea sp.]|nr:aspartate kinase [Anaerolinea sp.]